MHRIVIGFENGRDPVNQIKGGIQRERIAAGKQQPRTQLDLDPHLVATDLQLTGLDEIPEGRFHRCGDILQGVTGAVRTASTDSVIVLAGNTARQFRADLNRVNRALRLVEGTDQRIG